MGLSYSPSAPLKIPDATDSIGTVTHASAKTVEVLLTRGTCRVNEYVLIHSEDLGLLGQIIDIRVRSNGDSKDSGRLAVIEILFSIELKTGKSEGGVVHTPAPGDNTFPAPADLVQRIVEDRKGSEEVRLTFSALPGEERRPLSFTPEQIFGRHCAVVGATGGGKSWTMARLVEECGKHRSKVILFDATGEYRDLFANTRHLVIGKAASPTQDRGEEQVSVPFYHLTEMDLFAIFQPSGDSQGPKLRSAMKSLKLAGVSSQLSVDGTIMKAHKSRVQYDKEYRHHREVVDSPMADFEIQNLARQIENECVFPQRSPTEPLVWGGINGRDHSNCVALIGRISDVISAPAMAPIFDPGNAPSLFKVIHEFIDDPEQHVLRVSLEHFSFANNAREIVVNAIGRHLLDLARLDSFKSAPLVVFLDEAHQFLNANLGDENADYPLNSFSLIAKEGRKYALTLCLATQRPRDIPDGVLSQMGTLIVHRIINDIDRRVIERASGDFDKTASALVPTLTPGEAVIIGPEIGLTLKVHIAAPEATPVFEGPNYQKAWKI